MHSTRWLIALCALGVVPFAVAFAARRADPTVSPESVTALTHVLLIDGTGAPPRPNMTVVVSRGRIAAIFPSRAGSVPEKATVLDLSGRVLIPGLIDSHVHLGTQARDSGVMEAILKNVFMDGVTTVRDMGGSMRIVRPLAVRSVGDSVPSPRVFYSAIVAGPGRWFEGDFGTNAAGGLLLGSSPLVRKVDSTTNVAALIADAKNAGATAIKIYNAVDPRLVRALTVEAHRRGLKVWSHLWVDPGRPSDMISAGVEVVSHADQFRSELVSTAALGTDSTARALRSREVQKISASEAALEPILRAMRRNGTMLDPTLSIMLPGRIRADTSRAVTARSYATFEFAAAMTARAAKAGIPIVAGTDAIGGSAANLHLELQMLVDSAHLSPLQALTAATLNGAIALGAADSLGSVNVGKVADLVVLCDDPSREIRNTQAVYGVMKRGRFFRRTTPLKSAPLAKPPQKSCS